MIYASINVKGKIEMRSKKENLRIEYKLRQGRLKEFNKNECLICQLSEFFFLFGMRNLTPVLSEWCMPSPLVKFNVIMVHANK